MNSRLDTLQAAVLLKKLQFFDSEIERCNWVATEYTKYLSEIVRVADVKEGVYSSWAQYTVCFKNRTEREAAAKALKENGIPTAVYYKKPMHMQAAFKEYVMKDLDYSVTQQICDSCLSLPMHPYLSQDDVQNVIKIIRQIQEERI